jgi:predicted DNA-binding protein (UPF0251 family)
VVMQPGEAHIMSRLSREDVELIRRLRSQGWRQVDIAARFGVSQPLISNIINGHKWKTTFTGEHRPIKPRAKTPSPCSNHMSSGSSELLTPASATEAWVNPGEMPPSSEPTLS